MDLASVLIGLVICVVTAAILYLISVKSFQEKPFEEVLAEQQQFADSLLKGEKSNKEKEKKYKKQPVKKNKEKEKGKKDGNAAPASQSVPFEEKLHVEFEPDTEVIPEEPAAVNPEKEKRKSDKKDKVKPILRNRDQVSTETFDPDVDSLNHFAEHPPKDDVELKAKEKDKSGGKKGTKPVVEEKLVASETAVVEPVAVKEVAFTVGRGGANNNTNSSSAPAVQPAQPGTPKKQRKKNAKTDSLDTIDGGEELLLQLGGTEKLLSAIRQLPLTSSELQTMIEVLLNRQQEASGTVESEWMERGGRLDPIGALRKQLAEKDKALQEELEEKQVYQNKLRTLGTEMATERNRAAAARKQLEESLARQTAEMQMLTVRLQQSTEQHVAEVNALRVAVQQAQKVSQTSDEHLRQLQRLQDEKNQFDARFATAQQMQQEMGARVQQLEDFLMHKDQQLLEQANQIAILGAKLQESEQVRNGQNHEVQREVAQLREALQASETQSIHMAQDARVRLEEMERTKQLLEDRITKVDRDLAMERSLAAQNEERIRQEVSRLCLENQALTLQLSNSSQTRQDDDVKFATLQEQLQMERNQAAGKEAEAQQELERLRSESQSLSQQLSQALESHQSHQSQLEVTLKSKDDELEAQKRKNNELRDKNYKAMDALAAAEKALVELKKATSAVPAGPTPAEINQVIGAGLKKVFPDLSFDASATPAVFTDSLVVQVSQSLDRLQGEEQSKAQAQVVHYKTVLSQTEELLNRLQSRVEAEEASWKVKMIQIESDLMTVKQERDFWMDQCQKQEEIQGTQQKEQVETQVDVTSLHSRIESLQKEKEQLLQEVEKERQAAAELSSQSGSQREQLLAAESSLAEERRAVQHLRDQLDQAKAQLSAAKVGSIGFMVGWAKSSAATVAAATARKNSLNSESLSSEAVPPSAPQQDGMATKCLSPATNGNGTKTDESPIEEQITTTKMNTNGQKSKNRKKKVASHFAS